MCKVITFLLKAMLPYNDSDLEDSHMQCTKWLSRSQIDVSDRPALGESDARRPAFPGLHRRFDGLSDFFIIGAASCSALEFYVE